MIGATKNKGSLSQVQDHPGQKPVHETEKGVTSKTQEFIKKKKKELAKDSIKQQLP